MLVISDKNSCYFPRDFPFSETGLISKCKSRVQLFNVQHIGINLTRLRSGDQVSFFPFSLLDEFCPIPEKERLIAD